MSKLNHFQIAEYFHRSYKAVDGLWFMKLEELADFDTALRIDTAVWQVMPKIQARKLKELLASDGQAPSLLECFTAKLELDGFTFTTQTDADGPGFTVSISRCPWYELMAKSGRAHLADRIGQQICNAEYSVWAAEFGSELTCTIEPRICANHPCCKVRFAPRE